MCSPSLEKALPGAQQGRGKASTGPAVRHSTAQQAQHGRHCTLCIKLHGTSGTAQQAQRKSTAAFYFFLKSRCANAEGRDVGCLHCGSESNLIASVVMSQRRSGCERCSTTRKPEQRSQLHEGCILDNPCTSCPCAPLRHHNSSQRFRMQWGPPGLSRHQARTGCRCAGTGDAERSVLDSGSRVRGGRLGTASNKGQHQRVGVTNM